MKPEGGLDILDTDLAGYRLLEELVPEQTFLCCDVSENIVVLKRLEDDCLHRQQLHPSIKDRLARVRELAHPRIATLRTVERWNGRVCLVWTYLDGEIWDDAVTKPDQNLLKLCSDLTATVDALHETGIVHGSLHGRNIVVRPDQQVWLTHVSPYLYADRHVDIAIVADLFRGVGVRLSPGASARFMEMLDTLSAGKITLREFSHLVLSAADETAAVETKPAKPDRGYRLSSLLAAIFIAGLGAAFWITVHRALLKSAFPPPTTFPSLRQSH